MNKLCHFRWITATLLAIVLAVLSACGGGGSSSSSSTEATVGAAGGTVHGPDGIEVVVPADAVGSDITLRVARDATDAPPLPEDYKPLTSVYSFTPHGIAFQDTVTVRTPFDKSRLSSGEQPAFMYSQPGGRWTMVVNGVDDEANALTAPLMGFSWAYVADLGPIGSRYPMSMELVSPAPSSLQFASSSNTFRLLDQAQTIRIHAELAPFMTTDHLAGSCYTSPRLELVRVIGPWPMATPYVTATAGITTPGAPVVASATGPAADFDVPMDHTHNGTAYFLVRLYCERWRSNGTIDISTATNPMQFGFVVLRVGIATPVDAPTIAQSPADTTVVEGSTASFAVSVSGTPTPALQWQISTDGGTTWSNIPGATGSTYTTAATTLTDSGSRYRVVATNASGSATSTAATLTVTAAPPAGAFGTRQLGVGGAPTTGKAVATDTSNNVYVAGSTEGALDGNTQTGPTDFFLTKFDSSGVKQYTRQLGATGAATTGQSVATDAAGNLYVAGSTNGSLDGNALTGITDFFVTKFDSGGVKQFTRQLGVASAGTYGHSVATDTAGNVYVTGETSGSLDGNTRMGTYDFFVTKYNSSGVKQFTRQLGVAGSSTYGTSVATDAAGNVYVAGYTTGNLDGNTLMGTTDFFVTKYDSSGAKQYTRQLGIAGAGTQANSVVIDVGGNVYVAGFTDGDLDGNALVGVRDLFVTKFDSNGAKQYTRQLGATATTTNGQAIATDASGSIYVVGATDGGLDGNTLAGNWDFFVTKYDGSGIKQYTRQLGAANSYSIGLSAATDTTSNVYVAGSTTGGLDGNTRMGTMDFFVTKYDSNGVKQ